MEKMRLLYSLTTLAVLIWLIEDEFKKVKKEI